jgi:signal peptidase II
MDKFFFKKIILYFGIVLIIFLVDRISKLYILSVLENSGEVDIYINSYINLILVWNSGIGFGLLSFDKSTIYNSITILIIFINLIILYLIIKSDKIRSCLFLIILGGSTGNLFDRIYYSAVPDFIDISYKGYHWFIFNVADIFISIGIICLIFVELMNYKKRDEN